MNILTSEAESLLIGLLVISGMILLIVGIIALVGYILKGIGMYTMAVRQGMPNLWLAFIPFARTYRQGELSGDIILKQKAIRKPGIWLMLLPVAYGVVYLAVNMVMNAGMLETVYLSANEEQIAGVVMNLLVVCIVMIVLAVAYEAVTAALKILINRQIFERFTTKNMAILHAVLCVFIPLYEPVCFFIMRNKPYIPGMEPEIQMPYGMLYGGAVQEGYMPDSSNYGENRRPDGMPYTFTAADGTQQPLQRGLIVPENKENGQESAAQTENAPVRDGVIQTQENAPVRESTVQTEENSSAQEAPLIPAQSDQKPDPQDTEE